MYAESVGSVRISLIDATTRGIVRGIIADGIKEGHSIPRIARRIRDAGFDEKRALVIARTETHGAAQAGVMAGAKATGITLDKEWISTFDNRTRPHHIEAHGQIRRLDEPFTVNGESLMHPGDSSLGATGGNLVMCRCTHAFIPT